MSGTVLIATTTRSRGGLWRHVEDLGIGLAGRGFDVTVGLDAQAEELRDRTQRLGLKAAELGHSTRERYDVWHVHLHDTYETQPLRLLMRRRLRGPAVITEHLPRTNASDPTLLKDDAHTPGSRLMRTAFKRAQYGLANLTIAVSARSAGFIASRYRPRRDKLRVVHNGVSVGAGPQQLVRTPGPLRVVAPGSLIVQKGHDLLMEAARHATEAWEVIVVGDGPHRRRYEEMARDTDGRVTFVGWRDDVDAMLLSAAAVCLPSRWESFPYSALEASAAMRPLIVTDVDGLDEIVVDGRTGFVVPPEDPVALAAALDRAAACSENSCARSARRGWSECALATDLTRCWMRRLRFTARSAERCRPRP